MSRPVVVACVPAYNEERTIGSVVVQTKEFVDKVIVCDDGSMDLTGKIAEGLGAVVVRHEINKGKGAAIRTALDCAKKMGADVVVVLDADGQHDPGELSKLVEPVMDERADMVVGSRYVEGAEIKAPLYRRLGLKFINALSNKSNYSTITDTQSGFRAFSSQALDIFLGLESEGYGVETEQLSLAKKHGLRVMEVPVSIRYAGLERTSKKHPLPHGMELIGTLLRLVVEEKPLLLLGGPGFFFILLGFFMGAYFLWLFNETRYFSLPMAIITLGSVLMGTLLIITSLILYSMIRMREYNQSQ